MKKTRKALLALALVLCLTIPCAAGLLPVPALAIHGNDEHKRFVLFEDVPENYAPGERQQFENNNNNKNNNTNTPPEPSQDGANKTGWFEEDGRRFLYINGVKMRGGSVIFIPLSGETDNAIGINPTGRTIIGIGMPETNPGTANNTGVQYNLYNPYTGERIIARSEIEKNLLIGGGWQVESEAGSGSQPVEVPIGSALTVYDDASISIGPITEDQQRTLTNVASPDLVSAGGDSGGAAGQGISGEDPDAWNHLLEAGSGRISFLNGENGNALIVNSRAGVTMSGSTSLNTVVFNAGAEGSSFTVGSNARVDNLVIAAADTSVAVDAGGRIGNAVVDAANINFQNDGEIEDLFPTWNAVSLRITGKAPTRKRKTPCETHTWGKATYTWRRNYKSCTAWHKCTKCGVAESAKGSITSKIAIEATCEKDGMIQYTAAFPGYGGFSRQIKKVIINALGHDWGEWSPDTTNRVEVSTCQRCGETGYRSMPATPTTPHEHELATVNKKEATCAEAGYTGDVICRICREKLVAGKTIPALGHQPAAEWSFDGQNHWHDCQNADCTEKLDLAAHSGGTATCTAAAVCAACGQEYGNPLGHQFSAEWSYDGQNHWHACTRSGCEEKRDEAAHSGGAATCAAAAVCETCGQAYGDPLGHQPAAEWSFDGQNHWHACQNSGCTEKLDLAAHSFEEVEAAAPATCLNSGRTAYYRCSVCEQADIPSEEVGTPLGHQPGDTWEKDGENHWRICIRSDCGQTLDLAAHTFVDGVCTVCGQPQPMVVEN